MHRTPWNVLSIVRPAWALRWMHHRAGWVLLIACAAALPAALMTFVTGSNAASADAALSHQLQAVTPLQALIQVNGDIPLQPAVESALEALPQGLITRADRFSRTRTLTCGQPSIHCYQVATFPDLDALFTLRAGRLPNPAAEGHGGTTDAPLEVLINADAYQRPNEQVQLGLGDRVVIGSDTGALHLTIVGVYTVRDPALALWSTLNAVTSGVLTEVGSTLRYDFALVVHPQDYPTVATGGCCGESLYGLRAALNPNSVRVDQLNTVLRALYRFEQQVGQAQPDADVSVPLTSILSVQQAALSRQLTPVTVLMWGMLLVLSAGHIHLGRRLGAVQAVERSAWQARGASRGQRAAFDLLTNGPAVLAGTLAGWVIGLALSGTAALEGVIGVGITALLTTAGLLTGAGHRADRAAQPWFARVYLDVLLLVGGAGLALWSAALGADPTDPLHLLVGPVLAGGIVLLGLRVMSSALGMLPRWRVGLHGAKQSNFPATLPVLLFVSAVSVGSAALTLGSTLDEAAWQMARHQLGGDALVTRKPAAARVDWAGVEGVSGHMDGLLLPPSSTLPLTVLGIDPQAVAQRFPDLDESASVGLSALMSAPPQMPGLLLPIETANLSVNVYAVPTEGGSTRIWLDLMLKDQVGYPATVRLTTQDPTSAGRFVAYAAQVPPPVQGPWRAVELRVVSQRSTESFDHTLYLDDFTAGLTDGGVHVIADFEALNTEAWQMENVSILDPTRARREGLGAVRVTSLSSGGSASLRIDYRITRPGDRAIIPINGVRAQPLPVLMSPALAESEGLVPGVLRGLSVGEDYALPLRLPLGDATLNVRLAAINDDLPALVPGTRALLAPLDPLRLMLNTTATSQRYYDVNRVWLDLTERQPSPDQREVLTAVPGVESVVYAWDAYRARLDAPLASAPVDVLSAGFAALLLMAALSGAAYAHTRQPSPAVLWLDALTWMLGALVGAAAGGVMLQLLAPLLVQDAVLRVPVLAQTLLLLGLGLGFSGGLALISHRFSQRDTQ